MKTWKLVTAITLAVTAVALITASVFAYMGAQGFYSPYGTYQYGNYPQYPPQSNSTTTITPVYPPQNVYPYQFGPGGWGCPGRAGWNGYAGTIYPYNGISINITTATAIAQGYLTSRGNPDLAVTEVEEYTQNFYVQFSEKSTGIGAFEMLIDKYTGSIYPEMGPNMMWNTKYGMMSGGMMGWFRAAPSAVMQVTPEQAKANAQQFLNANLPGTTVEEEVTPFYGYYHIMVLLSGNDYGMLSVNGYTGQVWYHNWHGTFIQELKIG